MGTTGTTGITGDVWPVGWGPVRVRLLERMCAVGAVQVGGPFKLAAGGESDHYFDVKKVLLDRVGLREVSRLVALHLSDFDGVTAVGGPELGAVPLVGATLMAWDELCSGWYDDPTPFSGFIVRKTPKAHGTGKLIEGNLESGALPQLVALVEDVTTTAASVVDAIEKVEAVGARVVVVFVVVNRGGAAAREAVESRGAAFVPLFESGEILEYVRSRRTDPA